MTPGPTGREEDEAMTARDVFVALAGIAVGVVLTVTLITFVLEWPAND